MSESVTTNVLMENGESLYYKELEKHINSLSERYRSKSVIRQNGYNDIIKCVLLLKGTSSHLFSSKFIHWAKQNFILTKIGGVDICCCIKSKKTICTYETYYNVIGEAHASISHGGRDKTSFELNSHYSWIPRFAIEIFLKQCIHCQTRKPLKQHVVAKPIISLGVMTRLQVDLIDMRTRPDQLNPDIIYKWILNCIDHYSKFTWTYSLQSKSATEVALKLRELFFVFGPPKLLHSDNGKEFVATVIFELKQLFPDLVFVRGKPRHPQTQGCIERANGVLCGALGKWMSVHNSTHWSDGLLPTTYGINTRFSVVTKLTPYQVMFGQEPRCDSIFWKLVKENEIIDEEDLPTPIDDFNNDVVDDENDVDDCADIVDVDVRQIVQQLSDDVADIVDVDTYINVDAGTDVNADVVVDADVDVVVDADVNIDADVDVDAVQLVPQLSDDVAAVSLINLSLTDQPSVKSPRTKHNLVRKIATNNYMNTANKKMKLYQDSILITSEKFNLNDCVGVKIHTVDRTNTDANVLPCLIIEKIVKDNTIIFKLACEYGKLVNTYSVEQLVDLKLVYPDKLKQLVIDDLNDITFIEACKLYVRTSTTGQTCDCKGKCVTRQCPCKRMIVFCSTKCHSKRGGCANMGENT
ncbi:unnamed protein product [Adineta steineri]|uniref:Integrase catalytic domain-containing protein n=1 Tax=Adineta steineri TaxID=433720 RepID=A0A818P8R1_9BILA|nr:unnamed protein product [Adineta steineri]CAF3616789.1 unnamed protein product [Adineta steineri]